MDDNNDDDHLEDLDCSESEDVEFELVNKIVDVLTPIKLTVEAICRRDANLCTADAALNFLIKQLSSKTQHLPKIKTCLVDRIKQRRSDNLTGVLNYLQNPRKDEENQLLSELEWHNLFPVPTQALLRKQIKSIVKRLNSRDDTEEEERSESLTDVELRPETSQPQLTLKEKLQLEIDKSMKSPDPEIQVQNESGMTNSIRREMSLFENGGVRGYYLETAYKYLMSIPPTSVEPERAFSAAAYPAITPNKHRQVTTRKQTDEAFTRPSIDKLSDARVTAADKRFQP
ncbi:hypothetical protein EVAR_38390_1 [Eumeta japonica]|uniref:HAT C-terminal dimerisation domain-containing protein n=1 Tax=Eumeta variegata TaxID=151549 RepID=A0A4C1YLQ6_EUMVA|nr:hypothetical protein EVAR_38390_1 [Eumeta japonica]